jgi:hypothetical protein
MCEKAGAIMVIHLPIAHQDALSLHLDDAGLLGHRSVTSYTRTERQYSTLLYSRIEQLLRGQRNDLLILRKYPGEPGRLGVMPTPADIDRGSLRIEFVERMATDALVFLSAHSPGGPVAQSLDADGRLTEIRKFPTRYPHIIIERLDVYNDGGHGSPDHIQWHARRLQNQRRSIRVNQMLDLLGLGVEAAKLLMR